MCSHSFKLFGTPYELTFNCLFIILCALGVFWQIDLCAVSLSAVSVKMVYL